MTTIYIQSYDTNAKDRHILEHTIGRDLLTEGLRSLYGLTFPDLKGELACQSHGKPYLRAYPEIHFNISHCPGMVACGFSDSEIGLDIEYPRPISRRLVLRSLSPSEQLFLESQPSDLMEHHFFRLWTLKESRMKISGDGMTIPFHENSFSFETGHPVCVSAPQLFFFQHIFSDGCILSVCLHAPDEIHIISR